MPMRERSGEAHRRALPSGAKGLRWSGSERTDRGEANRAMEAAGVPGSPSPMSMGCGDSDKVIDICRRRREHDPGNQRKWDKVLPEALSPWPMQWTFREPSLKPSVPSIWREPSGASIRLDELTFSMHKRSVSVMCQSCCPRPMFALCKFK
jgi:hypothetical protein